MDAATFLTSILLALAACALCIVHEQLAGRWWNVTPVAFGGIATVAVIAIIRFIVS